MAICQRNVNRTGARSLLGAVITTLMAAAFYAPAASGQSLSIAHLEYTSNWNPISSRSRTSHLATSLTHESLFTERCVGADTSVQKLSFRPWCLQPAIRVSGSGSLDLKINGDACQAGGRALKAQDVKFTTDMIGHSRVNPFWVNKLRVDRDFRLWIGFPSPVSQWTAQNILTFPIMREPDTKDPAQAEVLKGLNTRRVGPGDEDLMNGLSAGTYRFENIRESNTKLAAREGMRGVKMPNVELKYFPLLTDLNDVLSVNARPDVVLGVPASLRTSQSYYDVVHSPDLNSFTYVGFNFRTKDFRAKKLFRDAKFRALFTKSLWATQPIRNAVDIEQTQVEPKGVYIGQSFDAGDPRISDAPGFENLKASIDNYLKFAPIQSAVRLTMLLSPEIPHHFDVTDRKNIERQLNELWSRNKGAKVKFRLVDPSGGDAAYKKQKSRNRHHLTFDSFKYGRSKSRYMMFVDPTSLQNELGVDLIKHDEVARLISENNRGRQKFLDKIAELFPVAVVGHFPRRDLHSTRVVKPDLHCPKGSFAAAYAEMHQWQRK